MNTDSIDAFKRSTNSELDVRPPVGAPSPYTGASGPSGDSSYPQARPGQHSTDQPATVPDADARERGEETDYSIRVVIAFSVTLVAHAISALLRTDPHIELVGEVSAQYFPQGLDPTTSPDIVLIECLFATASCSGLIHDLRDVFPSARMLVVSPDLDDESLAGLVAAGAVGCLTPDCSRDELMDAIRRVSQGEILFPATLLMRLLARQQAPRREGDAAPSSADWDASTGRQAAAGTSGVDPPAALAPRERQVLTAMATGLSTEEVAERLGITVHTVRTHLRNVLVKLNAHSKLEAVVIALRKGLIELPE